MPAPGLAAGVTFGWVGKGMQKVLWDSRIADAEGNLAFFTDLRGPGVTTANDGSLWVAGWDGRLTMIAREGGKVNVSGTQHTIDTLYTAFDIDDVGHVLFFTKFTDGGWALVMANIPEPGAMLVIAGAVIALWSRRR